MIIFFHVCTIGHYQQVVDEILKHAFAGDDPYVNKNYIRFCISGAEKLLIPAHPHIIVDKQTDSKEVREFYTLSAIEEFCKFDRLEQHIGFIHSKGVTSDPSNVAIKDWRNYMSYFILERWKDAQHKLYNGWDAYGVDLRDYPCKHYSGTFWIANANYIRKLPNIKYISGQTWEQYQNPNRILSKRHNAEFWIGMGNGRLYSAHDCGIDSFVRHEHEYPREKYVIN